MLHDGKDEIADGTIARNFDETDALVVDDLWIRANGGATKYLVAGMSFQLMRGQCTGLLGESGCGKTLSALGILDLVPESAGVIAQGAIRYDGVDLLNIPRNQLRQLRGNRISMVFQEAQSALNPVLRIGEQLGEVLRTHRGVTPKEARAAAIRALRKVRILPAESWVDAYPHELSGGMKQRVLIAMALICGPDFLLADEPTSSLDVVLQAEIMGYIARQRRELDIGILLITHDIALVSEHCQQVMVMYQGTLVEKGFTQDVLNHPKHPYTLRLLRSHPDWLDVDAESGTDREADADPVPAHDDSEASLNEVACRYRNACPRALSICHERAPDWQTLPSQGEFRCWNPLPPGMGLISLSTPTHDEAVPEDA